MFKHLLSLFILSFILISCSDDTVTEPEPNGSNLQVYEVRELQTFNETTGDTITYYSLRENKVIPSSEVNTTNWDIAFYRTTLYANHGEYGPGNGGLTIVSNTDFTLLEEAPETGYVDVLAGSQSSWYNYNFENHTISPKPGVVVVIKCADGKYAKMQILSYYKGYPDNIPEKPEDREDKYYSFKYSIQMNGTRSFE